MPSWVFPPSPTVAVPVAGSDAAFPVRRVFCVGRNYAAHAREMGRDPDREAPFFFTKPADAVIPDGSAVPYPPETANFQYEIELVVAIGKDGTDIPAERALDHVFGYAVGNDLTRRDLQLEARDKGRPWDWGKAFDNSAVIGPIRPVSEIGHPEKGRVWLAVNGAVKQDQDIADLIWSVPEIIAILSRSMTIRAGDLIYTGTPAGVGPIVPGDRVTGGVDGIGGHAITITDPRAADL
ncbi:fumarylpyruvate hydrolase [Azospirillum agricola]|uniref:fumarylacetoacetate hydrolase family protein n=1 Tax=Azospirillum agricola TaxID=1720247 RepID=UPI001AE21584|nr:fumarylacetoacetate hydrolase family protein [Azospirillum agricola]MBP2229469.1 fumarylpyruvate hydrolase [Azospirillum agricola]